MGIFDIFKTKKIVCKKCGYMNNNAAMYCVKCGCALHALRPGPVHVNEVPKAVYIPNAESGIKGMGYDEDELYGETMVLGVADTGEEETTILPDISMPGAYLIRGDTGEKIIIIKHQFVLGRSASESDYCIEGRTVISRKHAVVVFEEGRYFVVDMHSSNKTYVDDMELLPGGSADLYSGSQIRLADLDFTFFIE